MSIVEAIVLGVIQGLTEFLPISSSGHLALAEHLLGMKNPERNLTVTLLVHLASLAAVLVYYRRRLFRLVTDSRRELAYIVLATLPIVAVGALLEKRIEALHGMPVVICAMLVVNGVFIAISDRWGRGHQPLAEAPCWKALVVGIAQAIRVPGLSRSGSTIGTGWLAGLERSEAVRFSFLLSIPAVLGAVVWKARKLDVTSLQLPAGPTFLALAITFALSLLSIRIVEQLSLGRRWLVFAAYSVIVGIVGVLYFSLR